MNAIERLNLEFCDRQPKMENRPLLSQEQSELLEATFKDLANSTRLRLIHALIRNPGTCVGDLADALGMKITAISNHLRKLTDRGIVRPQRDGKQVNYTIVNPCTISLLDHGVCLAEALPSIRALMGDMAPLITEYDKTD